MQRGTKRATNRASMRAAPAPNVPGDTPSERMCNAMHIVLAVSKEELLKREAKWKKAQARSGRRSHSDLNSLAEA